MNKLFGTDGVRGVAGELLTPELAYKLGAYTGMMFKKDEKGSVVIARDTRLSGSMLKSALAAGFMAVGIDVLDLGVVPTPTVSYLIRDLDFAGGAMISASHNPYYDNGIKIFDSKATKLSDEEEAQIEEMIHSNAPIEHVTHDDIGKKTYGVAIKKEYENHLQSIVEGELVGLKIALDCGNGALYEMAPRLLTDMGARVYSINTEPNGVNINDNNGSTNPKLISELVVEKKCDIGFAFDGDADRVIAADSDGNIINGDHLLAILATDKKNKGILTGDTVVATVMSNMGLDEYLESIDVNLVQTQVGDKNVLKEMTDNDYILGGEQSGHLIMTRYNTSGDGLATALRVLQILKNSKKTSAELNNLYEDYPQVLLNARVAENKKNQVTNKPIQEAVAKIEEQLADQGRVNIRPSGTEPLIRVMIEGKDLDSITHMAKELVDIVEKELE